MSPAPAAPPSHDELPGGWVLMSSEGVILDCNAWVESQLGWPADALRGQPVDRLLAPASAVLFQSYVFALLRLHGNVQEIELTLRARDGQDQGVMLFAGPSARGVQLLFMPLRQRRRAQEELLRVKRAADSSPGMIFELVREAAGAMHFPYASESVRSLYGVTAEAAAASADAVFHRVHPDDLPHVMQGFRESARTQQARSETYRVQLPDGSLRWHEVTVRPRNRADGSTLWHGHVADVTLRQELAAARLQQQTAEEAARARSELMARISHELRTPLNAILGFTQLMLGEHAGNLSADQLSRLETIYSAGGTLLSLVNEVLDTTGLESGRLSIDCEPVPVAPLLAATVALVQPQAAAAGIGVDIPTCAPQIQVLANAQRLGQVLANLLSNAIKYNRPGGRVWLRVLVEPAGVQIAVHDSGAGLSEVQLAGLFQPFNRLGAERTDIPGTGLGLVITRQLVQHMQGDIEVDSREGEGSSFTVSLRRAPDLAAPAPALAAVAGTAAPAPAVADSAPTQSAASARRRVMYVEDNTVNVVLMEAILARRPDVQVQVARDGSSAIAQALEAPPDLFLLDLHLPDMDGFELLRALRGHAALAHIPAVVVSAAATGAEMRRASAEGFQAYWTKPLDVARTLSELDTLLANTPVSIAAENDSKTNQ